MATVSIIMPVYNGAKYLNESIQSVLNQDYTDFEFIIINDGSTDTSRTILSKYSLLDKRINIIDNPLNIGLTKSLNIGLKISKGKYIARIDYDDIWINTKLFTQLLFLKKNPNISLLGCSVIPINDIGQTINRRKIFNDCKSLNYTDIKKLIFRYNLFCHSSVIFKKLLIKDLGLYNEDFVYSQDYEYWFRILSRMEAYISNDKLVKFRIHSDMLSQKSRKCQLNFSIKAKIAGIKYLKKPYYFYLVLFPSFIEYLKPIFLFRLTKQIINRFFNTFK